MDQEIPQSAPQFPVTGHPVIDQALQDVSDLSEATPQERLDKLATVQEVLASVLENSQAAVQTSIPGVRPGQGA